MVQKPALIRLEQIHRVFHTGEVAVPVLRGIDLEIRQGEFLIIQGESGSGKTTLLNIIGGIDRPSSGEVRFRGKSITGMDDRALTRFRRQNISFVFQFYNLIPTLTAIENVAIASDIADAPMPPAQALALVGLSDRLHHFPSQLSGGQQQRVALARALVKNPGILLCDEPTGALDHETSVRILALLQQINRETNTTLVMITHAQALGEMAHRTAFISDGRIQEIRPSLPGPKPVEKIQW